MSKPSIAYNIPNLLCYYRIVIIPVMLALFYFDGPVTAWINVFLFALAGLSAAVSVVDRKRVPLKHRREPRITIALLGRHSFAAAVATNVSLVLGTVALLVAWRAEAEQKLRTLAMTDGLTGLHNRRYLDTQLRTLFARAKVGSSIWRNCRQVVLSKSAGPRPLPA